MNKFNFEQEPRPNSQFSLVSHLEQDFSVSEFIKAETAELHPEFAEAMPELVQDVIRFDNAHPSLMAYLLKDGQKVIGSSYVLSRDLTGYQPIEVVADGVRLRPIEEILREVFPEIGDHAYVLDLGGAYIYPDQRGRGAYGTMVKDRLQHIIEAVANKQITFVDAEGRQIDPGQVLLTVSNMGPLLDNPALVELKKQGSMSEEELSALGLTTSDFGKPRPESAAVSDNLRKHFSSPESLVQFILVASSSRHGGPLYFARIPLTNVE